jgi:hypothetical protein
VIKIADVVLVVHIYPSIQEGETEGLRVQGHPEYIMSPVLK